jgi:hypothetical protein
MTGANEVKWHSKRHSLDNMLNVNITRHIGALFICSLFNDAFSVTMTK